MERTKRRVTIVRGIAFDLEGTIVDVERLHHLAHLHAAADVGVNLSWEEALKSLPHFIGGPDEVVAAEIASLSRENVSIHKILSAKLTYFNDLLQKYDDHLLPRDGFMEFVTWVKELGLKIAIGTSTTRVLALHLLKQTNLLDEFYPELIVAKEEVPKPKPSPDVYYETARRMGITPTCQLVFEDSTTGLNSAYLAGCYLVAIPTIQEPSFIRSLYQAGAEAVFTSWNDYRLRPFVSGLVGA